MIKNFPKNLIDKDITEFILKSILEYLEIWDETLQIDFSNSIQKIFFLEKIPEIFEHDFFYSNSNKNLAFSEINEDLQKDIIMIYSNMKDIINSILKFLMKIISTDEKKVNFFLIF